MNLRNWPREFPIFMQHMSKSNWTGASSNWDCKSNSVKHLSTTSGELLTATKGITETIDDMGSGKMVPSS